MLRRFHFALLPFIVFTFIICAAWSQGVGGRKTKRPKHNDSSVTAQEQQKIVTETHFFLFPEFYHYWPFDIEDTTFRYLCFDGANNTILVDTLHHVELIRHINFVKTFTNYTHTYIDADGKPKPSLVSKTLYTYDKSGDDSWKSYDVINHYAADLREDKNEIVRVDTTYVSDSATGSRQMTIRKYYKVIETTPLKKADDNNE